MSYYHDAHAKVTCAILAHIMVRFPVQKVRTHFYQCVAMS